LEDQSLSGLRPSLVVEEAMELSDVRHETDLLDASGLLARNSELRVVALAKVTGVLKKLQFCIGSLSGWQTTISTPCTEEIWG